MPTVSILHELLSPLQSRGGLIFFVICFWRRRLVWWRWWNIYFHGERCATFHALVQAACTVVAHISVAAGEDDGKIVDRIKFLEAYHAME